MDFQEKLVYSQMHAGPKGCRLTAYTATAPRCFVCTAPERFEEDHFKRTGPDPDGHSDQATYFIPHIVLNGFQIRWLSTMYHIFKEPVLLATLRD